MIWTQSVTNAQSLNQTDNVATTFKNEDEELVQSETKDGKLEIVKRIKKVNPDGSYTIGYEADDGSFKIESRDVLGNIKGTYGFVDDEGEIKRVSYSTSNASEVFTKHEPITLPEFPQKSAVQRIQPKNFKKVTTQNTTPTSPTTTPLSVIQSIARRRTSSTTLKPPGVVYSSASPRVLLQRPSLILTSTTTRPPVELKTEGQIGRPEVGEEEDVKPVTEDFSESRNTNRRQLPPSSTQPPSPTFLPKEHVYNLQQSLGHNDLPDIYNSGVTSRPLFTTTRSSRLGLSSTTPPSPVLLIKPNQNYLANYQRSQLQEVDSNTAAYSQPVEEVATTTSEPASTTTNVPVVQIPPNNQDPLVAVRHPFQPGTILVPLSQLQNRIVPVQNMENGYESRRQYFPQPNIEIERVNVKRLNPVPLRPIPVQVDENGYIREMSRAYTHPAPIPPPVQTTLRPVESDISNEIDSIHPPVSTRDFQLLLNHLIMRQKKLEKISELTNPRVQRDYYQQPRYRQRLAPVRPVFVQKYEQPQPTSSTRQYVAVRPQYQSQIDVQEEQDRRMPSYELVNRRATRVLVPQYQQGNFDCFFL